MQLRPRVAILTEILRVTRFTGYILHAQSGKLLVLFAEIRCKVILGNKRNKVAMAGFTIR